MGGAVSLGNHNIRVTLPEILTDNMKTASLSELRKEIVQLPQEETAALLVRLAKYSKENKELLHYLLYEADFEEGYIDKVKEMIRQEFSQLNRSKIQFVKKGLQRILRTLKKHIKYSGKKETEIELLLFFCEQIVQAKIRMDRYPVIMNLYIRQLTAIEKAVQQLDEDLRHDYSEQIERAVMGI